MANTRKIWKFKNKTYICPGLITLDILKGKWKTSILFFIKCENVSRFNELLKIMAPINRGVLSRELNKLIKDGILTKETFRGYPLRTEYRFTPFGETLGDILMGIYQWGEDNADGKETKKF